MSRTKKNLRVFFNHTSTCLLFLLNPLFFFYYQEATKSVHKSDEINVVSLARPNNETEFIDMNFNSREPDGQNRGPNRPVEKILGFNLILMIIFDSTSIGFIMIYVVDDVTKYRYSTIDFYYYFIDFYSYFIDCYREFIAFHCSFFVRAWAPPGCSACVRAGPR